MMKTLMRSGSAVVFATLLLTTTAGGVLAQSQSLVAAQGPVMAELIQLRSADDVRNALESARTLERRGESDARNANSEFERLDGVIKIAKKDVDALKARIDQAKKEKKDADRAEFERDKRQMDLEVRLLERTRQLREAERRLGQAQRDFARAHILELEVEQRLVTTHARLVEQTLDPQADNDYNNQLRRWLDLQKTRLQRQQNMTSRDETVVERRLSVLEARAEWQAGAR